MPKAEAVSDEIIRLTVPLTNSHNRVLLLSLDTAEELYIELAGAIAAVRTTRANRNLTHEAHHDIPSL